MIPADLALFLFLGGLFLGALLSGSEDRSFNLGCTTYLALVVIVIIWFVDYLASHLAWVP